MGLFSALQGLLKGRARPIPTGKASSRAVRLRPQLESLEDRTLLTTWFVANGGSDFNPGTNPAVPLHSIQAAVNLANNFDTIKVAGGTYSYWDDPFQNNAAAGFAAGVRPASVIVWNKVLTIQGGYSAADFNTYNPGTNVTAISGGGILRGVFVGGNQQFVGLTLQGFSIINCLSVPEAEFGGLNSAYSFGGGMWVNMPFATTYGFNLTDINFLNDYSLGGPDNLGLLGGAGGSGTGGALALSYTTATLTRVYFHGNLAKAADGSVRGGVAQGGALFLDHAGLVGNTLTFTNNAALGGTSGGSGVTADGERSGALGGAASIEAGSWASLTNVTATSNLALAQQHPNGTGGNALGGAFYVEATTTGFASLALNSSKLTSNVAQAGNGGVAGGQGSGGGIYSQYGSIGLTGDTFLGNYAISGGGTAAGPVGGGALYLAGFSGIPSTVNIVNTLVQGNVIQFGASNNQNNGGGGAGLWLSNVTATLNGDIFNGNAFGTNSGRGSMIGQAILLINATGGSATVANITGGIIENHTNSIGAAALHARGGTFVNLHGVQFSGNTDNDNSGNNPPDPLGAGTYSFS